MDVNAYTYKYILINTYKILVRSRDLKIMASDFAQKKEPMAPF